MRSAIPKQIYFGLNYKNEQNERLSLPLKNIDVNVRIIESIARVEYSQIYHNNTDNTLHVSYIFPISSSSCFDNLSVKYKSYTLEGEIQKKEFARKKYNKAVSEGKTAVYAEITEEGNDLMSVKIGNMEPATSITINLSYIERLDTSANKLWKYTVLNTLTHRYANSRRSRQAINQEGHSDFESISILNYPYMPSTDPQAYKWKIRVSIEAKSSINFVDCPSYKIKIQHENENLNATVELDDTEEFKPDKDFTIYYSTEDINKPNLLLARHQEGFCALLNFVPQTNHKALPDAYRAEIENGGMNIPDIEYEKVKGEFIFLIDRSGSMSGSLIKMAREALVIFLKSIPNDSYFNIVSFGSTYEVYSPEGSLVSTQENITVAVEEVMKFEGDMGGTEILSAIQAVYQLKQKQGFNKKVFLLTDGAVYNMKDTLECIKENADKARMFSVGIGSSASRELIIQSARNGKGCSEFVDDAKKIGEKVVSLLTLSMQVIAHSFQLTFPMGLDPDMTIPHPETAGPVYEGKCLTFFVYFGKELAKRESVRINLIYKRDEQTVSTQQCLEVSLKDCLTDEHPLSQAIWKLGYHELFSVFDSDKSQRTDKLVLFGAENYSRNDIEDLSIKNGVLSNKTAFICVMKDENSQILSTTHSNIVIPQIIPSSFSQNMPTVSKKQKKAQASNSSLGSATKSRVRRKAATIERATFGENESRSRSRDRSPLRLQHFDTSTSRGGRGGSRGGSRGRDYSFGSRADELDDRINMLAVLQTEMFCREKKKKVAKAKLMCYDDDDDNKEEEEEEKEKEGEKEQELNRIENMDLENEYDDLLVESNKQSEPIESSYDKVFSIISQQDSTGKWEYSEAMLRKMGVQDEMFMVGIPKQVIDLPEALTLAITSLVLIYLKQKCAEHQRVWMLVFKKGQAFLRAQGLDLRDFQDFYTLV